jgi:AP-4 complex subunit epsilon-1
MAVIKYASRPILPGMLDHLWHLSFILKRVLLFAALLSVSFRLLSGFPSDTIAAHQASSRHGPVQNIRHLLTSSDPNEQYLFLSCLQCLEPDLWAGTLADRPAVLDGWEVERVMKLLDSPDDLIRQKVNSTCSYCFVK